jgi:hypothetical protein
MKGRPTALCRRSPSYLEGPEFDSRVDQTYDVSFTDSLESRISSVTDIDSFLYQRDPARGRTYDDGKGWTDIASSDLF